METQVKILTFNKLPKLLEKMNENFASKSIEEKVVKTEISLNQPQGQSIGDIWFKEQERS